MEHGDQGLLGYVSADTADLVAFMVLIISSSYCPSRFKTIGLWAEARIYVWNTEGRIALGLLHLFTLILSEPVMNFTCVFTC